MAATNNEKPWKSPAGTTRAATWNKLKSPNNHQQKPQ